MATTLKHKVTLRKKVAEEEPVATPAGNNGNGTKKWWLVIILVVVALAVALLLVFMDSDADSGDISVEVTGNTEVSAPVQSEESAAEVHSVAEEPVTEKIEIAPETSEPEVLPVEPSVKPKESPVGETTVSASVAPVVSSDSLDEQAHRVIRGDYGNGAERREKLGERYTEIQNRVNEMYRENKVL